MAEIAEGEASDPVARAVEFMSRVGPMACRLAETPEPERRSALEALAARQRADVANGAVRLRASVWVIEARA